MQILGAFPGGAASLYTCLLKSGPKRPPDEGLEKIRFSHMFVDSSAKSAYKVRRAISKIGMFGTFPGGASNIDEIKFG